MPFTKTNTDNDAGGCHLCFAPWKNTKTKECVGEKEMYTEYECGTVVTMGVRVEGDKRKVARRVSVGRNCIFALPDPLDDAGE